MGAVFALVLSAGSSFAQRYNFKFYGDEEGLHNLATQVIMQDRAGFLWVGTQNGLYRYDGNRFLEFSRESGLPSARIESLVESPDGTLWVGTRVGLARRSGNEFVAVSIPQASGIVGRSGIAFDRRGRLYFATERGLRTASPDGHGGYTMSVIPNPAGLAGPEANMVYVDKQGAVWYGCGDRLCRVESGEGAIVGLEEGVPPGKWQAMLNDLDGHLWLRSETELYLKPFGRPRFIRHTDGLPPTTNTNPTLALDREGRLLVPNLKGIARHENHYWEMIDGREGLLSNDVSGVLQDREGAIWVALLGTGIGRWQGYSEWRGWSDREGLSRESIWSLVRDTAGVLWVGTQDGLNYAAPKKKRIEWRRQALSGVDMVRTIAAAADGTLWIGGDPGGVRQLNPKSGRVRQFGAAENLTSDQILHIGFDDAQRLWVSGRQGLFRQIAADKPKFEQLRPAGTDSQEVFYMTASQGPVVWAAGSLGLVRWDGSSSKRLTARDGLRSDMVSTLAPDADGSLWIGYRDAYGLTHLRYVDGKPVFEHISKQDGSQSDQEGLQSDKVIFIGFDQRRRLWVGTDHGIDVWDRAHWRHIGRADGLIWDDCNSNAFLADNDGSVWVGTSRGVSQYRASALPPVVFPPPVVFTGVRLGARSFQPGASIRVPYYENSVAIHFAALTFQQESQVLFRYRFADTGGAWLETNQRELNYPKLPPGRYRLEVQARNAQGIWSSEPARLTFGIDPAWWQTGFVRISMVVLAIVLGRMIWIRRLRRMQVDQERLETAVADRTREVLLEKQRLLNEKARTEQQKKEIERLLAEAQQASRLKSEFLANMSHEIRTPMNGILGMTGMVLASDLNAEQREYLELAKLSADSLLTILNDVLDFSKIEAGRLELSPIAFDLSDCVQDAKRTLLIAASQKDLTVECALDPTLPAHVTGDPDRLRQVLLNLISNAIKFTHAGGIRINAFPSREVFPADEPSGSVTVQFSIKDTGIGIAAEKLGIVFEAFRQADGSTTRKYGGTGLGLAICARIVELMDGRIWVESELGKGSTFHFTCRFTNASLPASQERGSRNRIRTAPVNSAESARPLAILLAEDNAVNQRLVTRLLEKRGHRVQLAVSGREAIDAVRREDFDVVLMDVQMPDLDGLEATGQIRAMGILTPILAITAHTMEEDHKRCLAAGMDGFVNKPIEAAMLIETVESIAAGRPAPAS